MVCYILHVHNGVTCVRYMSYLKAKLSSYIQLETAAIFF